MFASQRPTFYHCATPPTSSSVDRCYTQLDHRLFVYDTYKTVKATRTSNGWVHMFTTHRPTLTLQLHNFDLFRTCRTALLCGNWQYFNWHDASRGPSAIAELLVPFWYQLTHACCHYMDFPDCLLLLLSISVFLLFSFFSVFTLF